jgi:hypothetical protein
MSDFTVIETQEQLNEVIKDRLEQQERVLKKGFEGYKSPDEVGEITASFEKQLAELQSKADQQKADLEEEVRQAKAGAEAARMENLRMKVASEYGIPAELAQRIEGTDEESIRADAKVFAQFTTSPVTPQATPERPVGDSTEEAFRSLSQKLFE